MENFKKKKKPFERRTEYMVRMCTEKEPPSVDENELKILNSFETVATSMESKIDLEHSDSILKDCSSFSQLLQSTQDCSVEVTEENKNVDLLENVTQLLQNTPACSVEVPTENKNCDLLEDGNTFLINSLDLNKITEAHSLNLADISDSNILDMSTFSVVIEDNTETTDIYETGSFVEIVTESDIVDPVFIIDSLNYDKDSVGIGLTEPVNETSYSTDDQITMCSKTDTISEVIISDQEVTIPLMDIIGNNGFDNTIKDPDFIPSDRDDSSSSFDEMDQDHSQEKDTSHDLSEVELNSSNQIEEGLDQGGSGNRTRKRKSKPSQWSRNVTKAKRLCGEEYTSRSGTVNSKKQLGPSCQCRMKCNEKISLEDRTNIHEKYWTTEMSWQQKKQFLVTCISVNELNRHRPRNNNQEGRRKHSYKFSFILENGKTVPICKVMFKNTLSVSEKFVQSVQAQMTQNPGAMIDAPKTSGGYNRLPELEKEKIRKHILSFPSYESHYSRERTQKKYLGPELTIHKMYTLYKDICKEENIKPASETLYRNIFNYEFNFGFHVPSVDTCDTCDKLRNKIACSDGDDKTNFENELASHQKEADFRYSLKRNDKCSAKEESSKKIVISVDLQKCLPTPYLTNAQSFYLRKLWTLNFTIHNSTLAKSHCMVWNESVGARGGKEMGSCLIKWANEILRDQESIENISVWSDNCAGQNRIFFIVFAYFYLLSKAKWLKSISHNFLLRGHTHLEVDTIHSIIERKKKKVENVKIHTPRDWAVFISTCKENPPLEVIEMETEDFFDISKLFRGSNSPFVLRKKNDNKENVFISKIVKFKVLKEEIGVMYYKTSFESAYSRLDLRRNTRQQVTVPQVLQPVTKHLIPISKEKYADLMTALQWIDKSVHSFYRNLPTASNTVSELPVSDED